MSKPLASDDLRAAIGPLLPKPQPKPNHHRPHTSLDGLTPREYLNRSTKDQTLNRTNF